MDDLAESRVAHFRHDTAGLRKQLQSANRCDEPFGQEAGVALGVTGHIGIDRLDVLGGLTGPLDPGHLRRRFFASSWVIVSPASACSRPRWSFAKK